MLDITIITPVYNEELSLDRYYEAIKKLLLSMPEINFSVIVVDDGSTDASWNKIEAICAKSSNFKAFRLSRNFGSHIALSAGIQHSEGDAIITLACDLQDPIEVIPQFIKKWQEGADIVWGKRRLRQDHPWRIWTSNLFFKLLKKYAMPKRSQFCTGSFFLIDKMVADCFKRFEEHNRITFALVAWTGFNQDVVEYDRKLRLAGNSGWTFSLMLKTMYDAFFAFSNLPARFITWLGIIIWILSFIFAGYLITNYLVSDVLPGWTGVMLLICILFGTMFLVLGLSMEYLRRIYIEVTERPLYFISKKLNVM